MSAWPPEPRYGLRTMQCAAPTWRPSPAPTHEGGATALGAATPLCP